MQRTRCPYFYDTNQACNKRHPGAGCAAMDGVSRQLSVIGTSDSCIATHPSDMAVALRVLNAVVETVNAQGQTRMIPIKNFYCLPGNTPHVETVIRPDELITAIILPAPLGGIHLYQKIRDRASYAFALVSIAAVVQRDDSGQIAVGGIAPRPWRIEAAEADLPHGTKLVANSLLVGARPRPDNAFKLTLVARTLAAVMHRAKQA